MAEILSEFGHLVGLAGGNNIQATTMPTYSSVPLGTIVQYIGTTTADYINGYFYKATATGWEQHDTQPASNADNSITAFKESSPAQAAHAVDDYIRYNNVTYIVTAAIAIGDTLTIGTNIAVPTLDEGTVIYTPETGGGSAGGGHVIVNPSGTEMAQRGSLQFVDANVTDDSTNDKTKIENIKVINSESELTNASDGMYMGSYDDEADGVISADMVMYDSETTVEDELDNKVDKVTGKGLSTNDYDNIDKAKVGKIDETTTSISGNPISISGLKSNQLAKDPIITFEPIQAGSGDPSPSNVRAISGYDKIEVLSCGKNLIDCPNTSISTPSYVIHHYDCEMVKSSGYHVFSFNYHGNTVQAQIQFFTSDNSEVADVIFTLAEGLNTVSINLNGKQSYINFFSNGVGDYTNFQLEYNPNFTSYEPYKSSADLSLQIGQTIYGGTLNLETGVLTVDRMYRSWKWSDGNAATNITNVQRRVFVIGTDYRYDGSKWLTNVTNTYLYDAGADVVHYYYESSTFVLFMPLNTDGNTEIQLVYPLATPFTIQLTPHEISLLKDYAYVSTNGNNISFSYKNGEIASLRDVAQLGQTVNELGDRNPIIINRKEFFTSAAEISYTGISIPVEFGKIYVFSVRLIYQNSKPYHVSVSEVNDAVQSWRIIADADGCYVSFVYSPADNSVNNLYIWATYSNAAENHILIRGLIYPMN